MILGSAVSNDGGYSPFMTPSVEGQRAVLKEAYLKARVSPGSVHYVEAHGTGTRVGDPVEAASLSSVVGEGRPEGQPCFIGSCKTNIGHLEAAAGVAELIKAALSVKHGVIPPSLHCENPNPEIPWADYRLAVQRMRPPGRRVMVRDWRGQFLRYLGDERPCCIGRGSSPTFRSRGIGGFARRRSSPASIRAHERVAPSFRRCVEDRTRTIQG